MRARRVRKRSTGQFRVGEDKVKFEYLSNQYSVVLLHFVQLIVDVQLFMIRIKSVHPVSKIS